MSAHTPGPWSVVEPGHIRTESLELVAVVQHGLEAKARARLIAAAPELLAALKECADRLQIHMKHTEDLIAHMQACKAIERATGEAA